MWANVSAEQNQVVEVLGDDFGCRQSTIKKLSDMILILIMQIYRFRFWFMSIWSIFFVGMFWSQSHHVNCIAAYSSLNLTPPFNLHNAIKMLILFLFHAQVNSHHPVSILFIYSNITRFRNTEIHMWYLQVVWTWKGKRIKMHRLYWRCNYYQNPFLLT